MIRRPPRSTRKESSAASDVYKRQFHGCPDETGRSGWFSHRSHEGGHRATVRPRVPVRPAPSVTLAPARSRRKSSTCFPSLTIKSLPPIPGSSSDTDWLPFVSEALRYPAEESSNFAAEVVTTTPFSVTLTLMPERVAAGGEWRLQLATIRRLRPVSYTHLTLPTTPYV